MAQFRVIAVDSFAGQVRSVDEFECHGIDAAYRKLGELAANRVGVIILDEHDGVWAEVRPSQIYEMTREQRCFYRHYKTREAA